MLELHGSIWRNHCVRCGKFYSAQTIQESDGVPLCECGGIIKPDVVLYEEPLEREVLAESVKELKAADTLIVGGTSLTVYPAAGLIDYFGGKNIVVINRGAPAGNIRGALYVDGSIGEILAEL